MGYHFRGEVAARKRIYARDGGMCGRCGLFTRWDQYDLGHIHARALGGGHEDSNLRVEHKACNRRAGQAMRQPGAGGMPWALPSRW